MAIEALSGKVFLLITGASRSIGRQIAITFGSLLQEDSHILLLARNINNLQEVAKNISSKVAVHTVSMDLGKASKSDFEGVILESLKETRKAFDRVVVVHNVGTVGTISKLINELSDVNDWKEVYDVNFFVPVVLNTVIMNMFDDSTNTKKVIINITSFYAIKEAIGYGQYCSVKAAREMYFKVFALENVNVLSYGPGPVETDMFIMACEKAIDPKIRESFKKKRETKTVLTTEQTVNRLIEVLKKHKYKSADHVDYYDEL